MAVSDLFPPEYYPSATRTKVNSVEDARAFLNQRRAQLQDTIANYLAMAETALDAGDLEGGRTMFAAAQPYIAELDRMTGGHK